MYRSSIGLYWKVLDSVQMYASVLWMQVERTPGHSALSGRGMCIILKHSSPIMLLCSRLKAALSLCVIVDWFIRPVKIKSAVKHSFFHTRWCVNLLEQGAVCLDYMQFSWEWQSGVLIFNAMHCLTCIHSLCKDAENPFTWPCLPMISSSSSTSSALSL